MRSQISQTEELQVQIDGKNRQVLKGYIPQVFLSCRRGVYRGLHLRKIEAKGKNIIFNLPEVLKKQPLRLLEPIIIDVELSLSETDLIASLDSDLLQGALTDLWHIIVNYDKSSNSTEKSQAIAVSWQDIALADNKLTISGVCQDSLDRSENFSLSANISLIDSHTLGISALKTSDKSCQKLDSQDELCIDLGRDVKLEKLSLTDEQLFCLGKIKVNN